MLRALVLAALAARVSGQVCGNQQDFSPGIFVVTPLTSGALVNNSLCPQHWAWFTMATESTVTYTRLEQQGTEWVDVPVTQTMRNGVAISVDAGYDYERWRFTTLAVLIVNGTPPSDISASEPYSDAEYDETLHVYQPITDRETLAFGYNETIGTSCQEPLADQVYIGVQCITTLGGDPCKYVVSATQLPYELHHGIDLTARIKPAWPSVPGQPSPRHYYRMSLGSYDTLQVNVYRVADGRPLHDANGDGLGIGLAGGVYMARGECPTNSSESLEQACALGLNATVDAPCEMGNFCSLDEDAGELVMMVEAEVLAERPVTYVDIFSSSFIGECEPAGGCEYVRNFVGPEGLRQTVSIIPNDGDVESPRYNEPARYVPALPNWYVATNTQNELRVDHGTYRLTVRQLQFEEGTLLQDEVRPGCVNYGQWRHFKIASTQLSQATLMAHLQTSNGVSGLYVRQSFPPTADNYDALALRSASGDNVHRLALSPCDVRGSTVWNLAVWLDEASIARPRGLRHTEFTLSVHLEDPTLAAEGGRVEARGGDDVDVPAQGATGDGFTCCGVFKYHLVPAVPAHRSLRVQLDVTRGSARALYLKYDTCPRYPEDVSGAECRGFCVVRWYTVYDPYDGRAISQLTDVATVPNGDNLPGPDLRGEGDWYVGVQALDGQEAEYTLTTELVDTPPFDTSYKCDRFDGPCPQEHWLAEDAELIGTTSGARPRRLRRAGSAASVLPLAAAAAASALMTMCVVHRTVGSRDLG